MLRHGAVPALVSADGALSYCRPGPPGAQPRPGPGPVRVSDGSFSSRSSPGSTRSSPISPPWQPATWCCWRRLGAATPWRRVVPGRPSRLRRWRLGRRPRAAVRSARPAPGPGAAAVHLGKHRVTEARAPVGRRGAHQRRRHRHGARSGRERPRGDDPSPALLLRALGAALAPGRRRERPAHRRPRSSIPSLWSSMRSQGVTSLAGVPHTFELLESSGAPTGSVPTLRQVTQAGGRLDPARVSSWAERGATRGLGPEGHVRTDRGNRADGGERAWVGGSGIRRPSGCRWGGAAFGCPGPTATFPRGRWGTSTTAART